MSETKPSIKNLHVMDADGNELHIGDVVKSASTGSQRGEVCGFGFISQRPVVFYLNPDGRTHTSELHKGWDFAVNVRSVTSSDSFSSIVDDAIMLGFTDPDNENLRARLIGRCKKLTGCADKAPSSSDPSEVVSRLERYVDANWPERTPYCKTMRRTPGTIPFELLAILNCKRF